MTCPTGQRQVPVKAIRELSQWTYWMMGDESGPLANLVCNEFVALRFVDPADFKCAGCGSNRDLAEEVRPVYERRGHDPDFLRKLAKHGITVGTPGTPTAAGPESPEDRLKFALVDSKITVAEYHERLAVLEGLVSAPDESEELPEGVRRKNASSFQANVRVNGVQRSKTFPTVEEADAQAAEWRAERDA